MRNPTSAVALSGIVGALDGMAASRDLTQGRTWDTTGIGANGTPVIAYGWAPAVQIGSAVVGAAAVSTGSDWGRAPLFVGVGFIARAIALKVAQSRQAVPTAVQGYVAVQPAPESLFTPQQHNPTAKMQPTGGTAAGWAMQPSTVAGQVWQHPTIAG